MAEISYSCDVAQGFNAQSDAQSIVGFLTDLKIGDTQFAIDLNVTDPEDVESELAVVGVISDIYWNGGEAEPIQISCRVSTQNKNGAIELVQRTLLNTSVGFSFVIYEYDPQAKKYFPCFHTGGETYEGLVLKEGGGYRRPAASLCGQRRQKNGEAVGREGDRIRSPRGNLRRLRPDPLKARRQIRRRRQCHARVSRKFSERRTGMMAS